MHLSSRVTLVGSFALLLAVGGCAKSLTVRVVDLDAGAAPIAGATVSRYPTPRRSGDAWTTTPADVQTTDADGRTRFSTDIGRFVVSAPGRSSASFYSTFPPAKVEIGLGAAQTAR